MPDPQPVDLTAFMATAGYAITQAPKDITEETGESLRALGTYYGPRLFAAVKVTLDLMRDPDFVWAADWDVSASQIREAITSALLGEGE